MKIDKVIAAIRQRCPSFQGRVAGYAQYASIQDDAALRLPYAYVVPLSDTPQDAASRTNDYRQTIRDRFGVLVGLPNRDIRGQSNANLADDIRDELNKALLHWVVDDRYYGICYDGKQLFDMNRAASWYAYEYYAEFELGPEDGWHWQENEALGPFTQIHVEVDCIEPSDKNIAPMGPDGRIEGVVDVTIEQE